MFKLGVDLPVLRAGYLNLNFIVLLIDVLDSNNLKSLSKCKVCYSNYQI